jgi:hypothetical protein
MNAPQRTIVGGMLIATLLCLALAFVSHAQTARPAVTSQAAAPQAGSTPAATIRPAHPTMNAEQEAVWNSPNMLRARAWLQEYCATSKNCKPGDYEKFAAELENMSAMQMKLWLMKFDEEEDQKKQQRAFYQQAQNTLLKQAKNADAATQKSYAAIEKEETGAANQEQAQLQEQEQNEQQMQDDKQLGPYTPYGQGMYPGMGDGVHYHFHLYPY